MFRPLIERVLQLSSRSRGLAWEINGIPCRIDARFRAQLARDYDAHIFRFLHDKIRTGHTCFDVGANVGAWVIQFAHMVNSTGRVVAFEPNPSAKLVLQSHIRLNHLEDRVRVVGAAVSNQPGVLDFHAAGADGMSRIGAPNPEFVGSSSTISVPVITLDNWCQENQIVPDCLLIDVEGYEGHVVAGATEFIQSRGKDLGIIVEMHPSLWPSSGTNREEVESRFVAAGRRAVPLSGQGDPFAEYGHIWLEPIQSVD